MSRSKVFAVGVVFIGFCGVALAALTGTSVSTMSKKADACTYAKNDAHMTSDRNRRIEGGEGKTVRVEIGACECEEVTFGWQCSVSWSLQVEKS